MPQMANITVKDNSNTDVVFTALAASGGDGVPARWRVEDASTPVALRATADLKTVSNGPKTARRMVVDISIPEVVLNTTTGLKTLVARTPLRAEITIPSNGTNAAYAATVALNFLAAALVKDSAISGFAPRN